MVKHELMIIADYSDESSLTLEELCSICQISPDTVQEFIAYEIIHPAQSRRDQPLFGLAELQRVKTALRLQHDLEVNMAGVALVLDLLDEMESLRARAEFLERQFGKR
ncbi:Chaperone modulatory protein CbpM [Aquicella siphonis]|uniref:Chaperone modulatory protein CbpM n=1 Tax=Aquicella siphonis TaxID=254247 RepID=A0A5E4PEC0_9COXI|nr:chaperone modulator CbpM [Aquicella siphonis]VVC75310.1 Chaperone modulatory protein CbpM [Aquicella siphonis]